MSGAWNQSGAASAAGPVAAVRRAPRPIAQRGRRPRRSRFSARRRSRPYGSSSPSQRSVHGRRRRITNDSVSLGGPAPAHPGKRGRALQPDLARPACTAEPRTRPPRRWRSSGSSCLSPPRLPHPSTSPKRSPRTGPAATSPTSSPSIAERRPRAMPDAETRHARSRPGPVQETVSLACGRPSADDDKASGLNTSVRLTQAAANASRPSS